MYSKFFFNHFNFVYPSFLGNQHVLLLYDDDDDDDDDFELGSISGCFSLLSISLSLADEFFVEVLLNGGPILLA